MTIQGESVLFFYSEVSGSNLKGLKRCSGLWVFFIRLAQSSFIYPHLPSEPMEIGNQRSQHKSNNPYGELIFWLDKNIVLVRVILLALTSVEL